MFYYENPLIKLVFIVKLSFYFSKRISNFPFKFIAFDVWKDLCSLTTAFSLNNWWMASNKWSIINSREERNVRWAVSHKVDLQHTMVVWKLQVYRRDINVLLAGISSALVLVRRKANQLSHFFGDGVFVGEVGMRLDDLFNRAKFKHHFLMVRVALRRWTRMNGLLHNDVYLDAFALFVTEIKKRPISY